MGSDTGAGRTSLQRPAGLDIASSRRLKKRLARTLAANDELRRFVRQLQEEVHARNVDAAVVARAMAALQSERDQLVTELSQARVDERHHRELLAAIYGSLSWALVRRLAHIRDWIAPPGSLERRWYERLRDTMKRCLLGRQTTTRRSPDSVRSLSTIWTRRAVSIALRHADDHSRPSGTLTGRVGSPTGVGYVETRAPSRLTGDAILTRGAALHLTITTAAPPPMSADEIEASLLIIGAGGSVHQRRIVALHAGARVGQIVVPTDAPEIAEQRVSILISLTPADAGAGKLLYVQLTMETRKHTVELVRAAMQKCRLHGARATLDYACARLIGPHMTQPARLVPAPLEANPFPAHLDSKRELLGWLADSKNQLVVSTHPAPSVSIVIPVFNRADCLLRSLRSIARNTSGSYEVVVVDDASIDETPQVLERVHGITTVRHRTRADFITTCNRGAARARGKYIVFLNSDTEVPPDWLSRLVSTLESDPHHGAVGARLVHPDGTLQEAGAIVWSDASTASYGRGADPDDPEYAYQREVDYCSAACLIVRADLFRMLNGFDDRYRPAYYEDVDLCFRIRRLGYKVVVDPSVAVVHHEFGSRPPGEAIALMLQNRRTFAATFQGALDNQHEPAEPAALLRARDRRPGLRTLVLDDQIPAPFLGAGFPRARQLLQMLSDLGCVVTFAATTRTPACRTTMRELQRMGIEVFDGASAGPEQLVRARAGFYDAVIVSRPHNGARLLDLIRNTQPAATVIYDAEALYYERELQRAALTATPISDRQRRESAERELRLVDKADRVIVVSNQDRDTIRRGTGHSQVWVWGLPQKPRENLPHVEQRRDLLFVGGFCGGHPPNTDAVSRLATSVVPRIQQHVRDCRLFVVGSQPTAAICQLNSLRTIVTGYVDDLTPYYDQCRVFVAPFRLGSGISCKVIEAMCNGIPAVVSPLIARGLELTHEREVLIGADDDAFANQVIRLYRDDELWRRLQRQAAAWVRRHCSPDAMLDTLADIVGVHGSKPVAARR